MEVEPEVEFAQKLAANEPDVREKILKKLGKWLAKKSRSDEAFTEDGMLKLWKGLFFYFWNCDKPLFQEDRAELISKYIHVFKKAKYAFLYIDAFFKTISREWFGIDKYRIEKFMMFVRKFYRECIELLKRSKWNFKCVKKFRNILKKTVINPYSQSATPFGLRYHFCEIYMEELARVGSEELTPKRINWFLVPYCIALWKCDDPVFLKSVATDVFLYLTNQEVDEEMFLEYPVLKFDAGEVQKLLLKYANKPSVRKANMRSIHHVIKEYENFKNDISPMDNFMEKLINEKVPSIKSVMEQEVEKAVQELFKEDEKAALEKYNNKISKLKKNHKKHKGEEEIENYYNSDSDKEVESDDDFDLEEEEEMESNNYFSNDEGTDDF